MTRRAPVAGVVRGSGNVFEDLGLREPQELLAKARLASAIADRIEGEGWTQARAADVLGTSQPNVSNLVNGRLEGFSMDRLTRFLVVLGMDVEIRVTPSVGAGEGTVRVAVG